MFYKNVWKVRNYGSNSRDISERYKPATLKIGDLALETTEKIKQALITTISEKNISDNPCEIHLFDFECFFIFIENVIVFCSLLSRRKNDKKQDL